MLGVEGEACEEARMNGKDKDCWVAGPSGPKAEWPPTSPRPKLELPGAVAHGRGWLGHLRPNMSDPGCAPDARLYHPALGATEEPKPEASAHSNPGPSRLKASDHPGKCQRTDLGQGPCTVL